MNIYTVFLAFIIILCILLNKLSNRIGVPMLLGFILLGMFFGSDGIVKIPFDDYNIAEIICSFGLIFIMFYGGFGTNWKRARPVAFKAVMMSSIGVILTCLVTGLFCHYILKIDFMESMLIGAIISSTDAASVFSIFRSKKINLKYNTASLLEVESGSNDPFAFLLTVIFLSLMSGGMNGFDIAILALKQLMFGLFGGFVIGFTAVWVLKKFDFIGDGFDTIFVFAVALAAYGTVNLTGGNGYLSVYIAGIILGNSNIDNKKSLVSFFDGLTGLVQITIFFLLGLLCFPSQFSNVAFEGLCIALFLTFIGRPLVSFFILKPLGANIGQIMMVAFCGLRGAASIVFSIMAIVSPAYTSYDVFHITFFIVLFSIALQGSLLVPAAKRLNMIDAESDVMKTFTDYSDETQVEFVKLQLKDNHPWCNKKVKDISLIDDMLLVLIIRGKEKIVPRGDTVLMKGDLIVLSALSLNDDYDVMLKETVIDNDHEWVNKKLSEIKMDKGLVILIKRNDEILIPKGDTVIEADDVLVMS